MFCASLVIHLDRWLVDTNVLRCNDVPNLSFPRGESGGCIQARKRGTDALLESEQVTLCEGIRLCNDRDEIDAGTETLHDLDIEGLETVTRLNSRREFLEGKD